MELLNNVSLVPDIISGQVTMVLCPIASGTEIG